MWFLLLLTVMSAALDDKGFVLIYRYEIAGLPINVLDGTLALGFLIAILGFLRSSPSRYQTLRAHPLFVAVLVLFTLGIGAGVLGAVLNNVPTYLFAASVRNMAALPAAIICGYYFLKAPSSARGFGYVHILGGICCAALILVFFVGRSAELGASAMIDHVRAVQYVSVYTGLAAAFLLFTLLDRDSQILPRFLAITIGAFCLLGQFGTLSRSDWMAATAAILAIPFLLPRAGRGKKLLGFAVSMVLLFGLFLGGMFIGAKITGRNLPELVFRRALTVLPFQRGDDSYSRIKAWDTRLPGALAELGHWVESPVVGQGFGYTRAKGLESEGLAFNHNVWTSSLASTGVLGFGAYLMTCVGMIVVGRRMVADRLDRGSVLIGAIGFTTGIYHVVYGAATMSFNMQRGAIAIGLLAGIVFRCRAMQLAQKEAYAGYLDDHIDRYE